MLQLVVRTNHTYHEDMQYYIMYGTANFCTSRTQQKPKI